MNKLRMSQNIKRASTDARLDATEKLLIDIHELSELTGIAVGSLYHMSSANQRRIPCVRLSQRCLRFSLPVIREWIESLSEPVAADETKRPQRSPR